jgi:hypothetical protein
MVAFRKYTLLPLDDCLHALAAKRPASDTLFLASLLAMARH